MKQLVIRTIAEDDLDAAVEWYESRHPGLGTDFLSAVEVALDDIVKHPEASASIYKNLRRAHIRRFPYGIFYCVHEHRIVVVGVIHGSQSPRVWKRRAP